MENENNIINSYTSDFKKIIDMKYKYIDKTEIIYNLIIQRGFFFLNRPRRFGKSLLISIIKCIFEGRKELFKNLFIYNKLSNWDKYPIITFDFSSRVVENQNSFEKMIHSSINKAEILNELENNISEENYIDRFDKFLLNAYNKYKKSVVILIDEYDYFLLNNLNNEIMFNQIKNLMKNFFTYLKSNQEFISFLFITGITNISLNNFFSGVNNIYDISSKSNFFYICGFTEEEIKENFKDEINDILVKFNMDYEDCLSKIKKYYDGYKFNGNQKIGIYNPIDILGLFDIKSFDFFWFNNGKSSFLAEFIKYNKVVISNLINSNLYEYEISEINFNNINPIAILYQTGYLTIDLYDSSKKTYKMKFSNFEIESNFFEYLKNYFFNNLKINNIYDISNFKKYLENGDINNFCKTLKIFFDDSNYQIIGDAEIYFHNSCYIFCKLLGYQTDVEINTKNGRIDMVVNTSCYIYIIEFKYNKNAKFALKQIINKKYQEKYLKFVDKKIFLVGINFDGDSKGINDYDYILYKNN